MQYWTQHPDVSNLRRSSKVLKCGSLQFFRSYKGQDSVGREQIPLSADMHLACQGSGVSPAFCMCPILTFSSQGMCQRMLTSTRCLLRMKQRTCSFGKGSPTCTRLLFFFQLCTWSPPTSTCTSRFSQSSIHGVSNFFKQPGVPILLKSVKWLSYIRTRFGIPSQPSIFPMPLVLLSSRTQSLHIHQSPFARKSNHMQTSFGLADWPPYAGRTDPLSNSAQQSP